MFNLSMPSNFNKESILQYAELNAKNQPNKVAETYGQMTIAEITASGRYNNVLPDIDLKKLADYVIFSKKHGIGFNYTLNMACLSDYEITNEGRAAIQKIVMELNDIGINTFTVALPVMIEIIQSLDKNAHIVASTICGIDSPQTAMYYEKMGVSRMILDIDITRDFKTIKEIAAVFTGDLELITNLSCLKGCPFKIFHYNSIAHSGSRTSNETSYYRKHCARIKENDKLHLLKMNWIRPEDIHFYTKAGVSYFKFAGRELISRKNPVKAAEYYLRGEYEGDLQQLLDLFQDEKTYRYHLDNKALGGFTQTLWASGSECTGLCDLCSICTEYAEKALKRGKYTF